MQRDKAAIGAVRGDRARCRSGPPRPADPGSGSDRRGTGRAWAHAAARTNQPARVRDGNPSGPAASAGDSGGPGSTAWLLVDDHRATCRSTVATVQRTTTSPVIGRRRRSRHDLRARLCRHRSSGARAPWRSGEPGVRAHVRRSHPASWPTTCISRLQPCGERSLVPHRASSVVAAPPTDRAKARRGVLSAFPQVSAVPPVPSVPRGTAANDEDPGQRPGSSRHRPVAVSRAR